MKIGILGGSFDPIHNGHLHMAIEAHQKARLDRILLMPVGHSPNKDESKMTSGQLRFQMCQLAAAKFPWLQADATEIESSDTSYTYQTLHKLKEVYPEDELYFIMGGDSLDYFDRWVKPDVIASLATILVIARDSFEENALHKKAQEIQSLFPANIQIIHCSKMNVASHEIREKIAVYEDVSSDLPDNVYQFIKDHHLYLQR